MVLLCSIESGASSAPRKVGFRLGAARPVPYGRLRGLEESSRCFYGLLPASSVAFPVLRAPRGRGRGLFSAGNCMRFAGNVARRA
jgi:hypothetical protein